MNSSTIKTGKGSAISEVPSRFRTARSTLLVDRFMTHFIKAGGIGIIAAVFGIFLFIFGETLPLFRGASVQPLTTLSLPGQNYAAMGLDEWGELPFLLTSEGILTFVRFSDGKETGSVDLASELASDITAFSYIPENLQLAAGTADGRAALATVRYKPTFRNGDRSISGSVELSPLYQVGEPGLAVRSVSYGQTDDFSILAAIQGEGPASRIHAVILKQERTLFSAGEPKVSLRYDLTEYISGTPVAVVVNPLASAIVVDTMEGMVFYFHASADGIEFRQAFMPFEDTASPEIAGMDFLFGGVSLVLTNPEGRNRIFSLYIHEKEGERLFGQTKEFKPLRKNPSFFDRSLRNKAFLTGGGNFVSLRYGTTEKIRWEKELPFVVKLAVLGRKYRRIAFLDSENRLHQYELHDPHPEAGMKAFFGKIWYEGYSEPGYEWQSTGGSDDFESKLSLIPLIIGTLKGTVYAMLFAFPIAILAAVYTSQFAHPRFRTTIKPMMEIMASLPSVVLGFLAALWLAPLIETKVPSLLLVVILVPAAALSFGSFWTRLPVEARAMVKPGYEWLAVMPLLVVVTWLGWAGGPLLEQLFFWVRDPETGAKIADFRLWWPRVTGSPFEQRNSLVVGFIMGFAVIPIIFTIAEDSLSNVPKTLVSGSLALGASRWQTAIRVVLPTAFPGIFSATMIGLGRAIGETMIVVMATGNTPIMDFNIFSGMRTLSANIAVELPEAPHLSTLYRTLFLGATALFLMTFVVNTAAEIIRQRLREKYRTV